MKPQLLIAVLLFVSCAFAGLNYPPETIELIPSSPNTPDVLNDLLIPADNDNLLIAVLDPFSGPSVSSHLSFITLSPLEEVFRFALPLLDGGDICAGSQLVDLGNNQLIVLCPAVFSGDHDGTMFFLVNYTLSPSPAVDVVSSRLSNVPFLYTTDRMIGGDIFLFSFIDSRFYRLSAQDLSLKQKASLPNLLLAHVSVSSDGTYFIASAKNLTNQQFLFIKYDLVKQAVVAHAAEQYTQRPFFSTNKHGVTVNAPRNGTDGEFEVVAWDFNSWKQLGSVTVPQSLNVFTGTPLYSAVSTGQNLFVCLHNETDGSSAGYTLTTCSPNAAVVLQFSLANNAQPNLVSEAPWSPSDNTASAPVAEASYSYVIFASSVFPAPGKPSVEIDIYSYE